MAYEYCLLLDDEELARTSAFAIEALAGEPAFGTRCGPGQHPPRRRSAGGLPVEKSGDSWKVLLPHPSYARLLSSGSLVSRSDVDAHSPDDVPILKTDWGRVAGFYREYLHDFDSNLKFDLLGIEPVTRKTTIVRSVNVARDIRNGELQAVVAAARSLRRYACIELPIKYKCAGASVGTLVLAIARDQWDRQPRIVSRPDMALAGTSFLESYLCCLLTYLMNVSHGTWAEKALDYDEFRAHELLVQAGRMYLSTALSSCRRDPRRYTVSVYGHQLLTGFHVFDELQSLSSAEYERRSSHGSVLFCAPDQDADLVIKLRDYVSLADRSRMRKLLEVSSVEHPLISDSVQAYGLGVPRSEAHGLRVDFLEGGRWRFSSNGTHVMEVVHGVPRVFAAQISEDEVERCLTARSGDGHVVEHNRIHEILSSAVQQRHGTALVISEDAQSEAQRLRSGATLIEPCRLSRSTASLLSSIDGALLVDLAGTCYAIGVIVDGEAAPNVGDPSRGARYNSLLRYVDSQRRRGRLCIAIVVSEDGHIAWIPEIDENPWTAKSVPPKPPA